MELDTSTLRVAFAVVALSMLVLFYFVAFRSTRSAYCGWWCAALTLFLTGSAAFLLNGTEQQRWANPLGNTLLVLGAGSAWAATRSLSGTGTKPWHLALPALATAVVAALDSPGSNVWAGGGAFLAMMGVMFGLAGIELWRSGTGSSSVHASMAAAAGLLSVFYLGRCGAFLSVGQDGEVFSTYFGSEVTTLVNLVFLVAVSFSMSVLGNEQSTKDLKRRATRDSLTGLLNRAEFIRLASGEIRAMRRTKTSAALILADLDNFKEINDTYGHLTGDRALEAFALACRATVRSTDLVGRYGGEEFILLLPGSDLDRAEQITAEISRRLQATQTPDGFPMPTVSYGLAATDPTVDLYQTIETADAALYRAKEFGRNRAVRGDRDPHVESSVRSGAREQTLISKDGQL